MWGATTYWHLASAWVQLRSSILTIGRIVDSQTCGSTRLPLKSLPEIRNAAEALLSNLQGDSNRTAKLEWENTVHITAAHVVLCQSCSFGLYPRGCLYPCAGPSTSSGRLPDLSKLDRKNLGVSSGCCKASHSLCLVECLSYSGLLNQFVKEPASSIWDASWVPQLILLLDVFCLWIWSLPCKPYHSTNQGEIYGSDVLSGYKSRPLREDEFHQRISSLGYGHPCEVSWVNVLMNRGPGEDEASFTTWPLILPSKLDPRLETAKAVQPSFFLMVCIEGKVSKGSPSKALLKIPYLRRQLCCELAMAI